ncbi:vacuolar sorting protein VPS33/slp1 [Quaeritorhiza haematococci]|nr:vacuolar sorting protein VPS33/slp1 [Quaeritorhiza haematococci]
MMEGNKVTYGSAAAADGSTPETKTAVLDESDWLWAQYKHLVIFEARDKVSAELKELLATNAAAKSLQGAKAEAIEDVKGQLMAAPEFIEKKGKIEMHLSVHVELDEILKQRNLAEVADIEQSVATGEDANEEKPKKVLDQIVPLLENPNVSIYDKMRMLMIFMTSQFAEDLDSMERRRLIELALQASDGGSVGGGGGMAAMASDHMSLQSAVRGLEFVGINVADAGKKKDKDQDRRLNYTCLIRTKEDRKAKKKKKKGENEGEEQQQYTIDRFVPSVKYILQDVIQNSMDPVLFPFLVEPPNTDSSDPTGAKKGVNGDAQLTRGPGTVIPFKSFKPKWAQRRPAGEGVTATDNSKDGESVDWRKNGCRLVIFVVGGLSFAEIRAAYEISKELKREIFIGSTHLVTPSQFVDDLKILGQTAHLPPLLPPIQYTAPQKKAVESKPADAKPLPAPPLPPREPEPVKITPPPPSPNTATPSHTSPPQPGPRKSSTAGSTTSTSPNTSTTSLASTSPVQSLGNVNDAAAQRNKRLSAYSSAAPSPTAQEQKPPSPAMTPASSSSNLQHAPRRSSQSGSVPPSTQQSTPPVPSSSARRSSLIEDAKPPAQAPSPAPVSSGAPQIPKRGESSRSSVDSSSMSSTAPSPPSVAVTPPSTTTSATSTNAAAPVVTKQSEHQHDHTPINTAALQASAAASIPARGSRLKVMNADNDDDKPSPRAPSPKPAHDPQPRRPSNSNIPPPSPPVSENRRPSNSGLAHSPQAPEGRRPSHASISSTASDDYHQRGMAMPSPPQSRPSSQTGTPQQAAQQQHGSYSPSEHRHQAQHAHTTSQQQPSPPPLRITSPTPTSPGGSTPGTPGSTTSEPAPKPPLVQYGSDGRPIPPRVVSRNPVALPIQRPRPSSTYNAQQPQPSQPMHHRVPSHDSAAGGHSPGSAPVAAAPPLPPRQNSSSPAPQQHAQHAQPQGYPQHPQHYAQPVAQPHRPPAPSAYGQNPYPPPATGYPQRPPQQGMYYPVPVSRPQATPVYGTSPQQQPYFAAPGSYMQPGAPPSNGYAPQQQRPPQGYPAPMPVYARPPPPPQGQYPQYVQAPANPYPAPQPGARPYPPPQQYQQQQPGQPYQYYQQHQYRR